MDMRRLEKSHGTFEKRLPARVSLTLSVEPLIYKIMGLQISLNEFKGTAGQVKVRSQRNWEIYYAKVMGRGLAEDPRTSIPIKPRDRTQRPVNIWLNCVTKPPHDLMLLTQICTYSWRKNTTTTRRKNKKQCKYFVSYKKDLSYHIFMLFYLLTAYSKSTRKTTISNHRLKLQLVNAAVPTQMISNWLT